MSQTQAFVLPPLPDQTRQILSDMDTVSLQLPDIMSAVGRHLTQAGVSWVAFDSNQIRSLLRSLGRTWHGMS